MEGNIFVNEAFTTSIKKYIDYKNTPDSEEFNSFLVIVIRILTLIYGELDIVNPYRTNNITGLSGFDANLKKYGLTDDDLNNFKNQMLVYYQNENNKSFIQIQRMLVDMFILKKSHVLVDEPEINEFHNLLYFKEDTNLIKKTLYDKLTPNSDEVINYLSSKLFEQNHNFNFTEYKDIALSQEAYQLAGFNIVEVMNMSDKEIENINNKLKECKKKDTYKLYGELLTANLYKLENNDNSHLSTIELENYYDNNAIIKIPLDNSVNIHGNIKKYYKKYNKLKNAEKIVLAQQNESLNTLQYLESLLYSINKSTSILDLNEIYQEIRNNLNYKKGQTQIASTNIPKIEPIIYKGYSIYIGRNNLQNDYLTLHFAKKNDLWFHAQKIQGSHVILKISDINNKIIPDDVLALCAHLAKENSKAALSTGVSIDYCPIKNVRKQPGGKPGMVIYTDYKTIYIK